MLGGAARLTSVRHLSGAAGELGVEGVVPGAVHGVALDRQGIQALPADRDSGRVVAGSRAASTCRPPLVRVAAMVLTTTSWLVSGLPRQFMVMCENSRCSSLFHCNDLAVVVVARV